MTNKDEKRESQEKEGGEEKILTTNICGLFLCFIKASIIMI